MQETSQSIFRLLIFIFELSDERKLTRCRKAVNSQQRHITVCSVLTARFATSMVRSRAVIGQTQMVMRLSPAPKLAGVITGALLPR